MDGAAGARADNSRGSHENAAPLKRSGELRDLRWGYGFGALRLTLPKRDILTRRLVQRDHHVVRRHGSSRGNTCVDVFQKGKPRFLRSPLNESEIENNQIVGVVHAD